MGREELKFANTCPRFRSLAVGKYLSAGFSSMAFLLWLGVCDVRAYNADDPWVTTASGLPATITWGFAANGTPIPATGESDLVSFFDSLFGVFSPIGNLTQRPWYFIFEDAIDRWSELSGVTFVYEPADDGATLQTSPGVLGTRADIRLAGKYIDGPSAALAAAWMPDTGDVVLDTGDAAYYSNPITNYRRARNTIMHEVGHTLGLMHVVSSDASLLMEPHSGTWYEGPQLDDIRGIHHLYGDVHEKSHGGLGNGKAARATSLGSLSMDNPLSVGGDAVGDQEVSPLETDFVSIRNSTDFDFYSFVISAPGTLDVNLIPWGGSFNQAIGSGPETLIDAISQSDLSLAVFAPNGTTALAWANDTSAGAPEAITGLELTDTGRYYVRVRGDSDSVQLYELQLSLTQAVTSLAGDFNSDGSVNGSDFIVWQRSVGATGLGMPADGNNDGRVDAADLDLWRINFGDALSEVSGVTVPEPGVGLLSALGLALLWTAAGRNR